ncbi:phospholipase A2-like [Peromyscus maniculatus bairdii]|uniref:phospholipase A2-like n=1 Tax=Peromyscus maniculatus bairdii TaxID=230844 RepID=UPI003FD26E71
MKLLLLVALLTAGVTASRVRRQAGSQFGNLFKCTVPFHFPFTRNYYRCYCDFFSRVTQVEKRCCQTRDNCRDQVKKLENCKFLIDNPQGSFYSYLCSGNEVICSGRFILQDFWTVLAP